MNAITGSAIDGLDDLKQSIRDILTTPMGSRVMRRDYGSRLPDLVDAPINRRSLAAMYAATASALRRWEPRFKLRQVSLETAAVGRVLITVSGEFLINGRTSTSDLTVEVAR